ncbi:MAG: hypothetical protein PVG06_10810 [Desulfobacterales bacterium]
MSCAQTGGSAGQEGYDGCHRQKQSCHFPLREPLPHPEGHHQGAHHEAELPDGSYHTGLSYFEGRQQSDKSGREADARHEAVGPPLAGKTRASLGEAGVYEGNRYETHPLAVQKHCRCHTS